MNVRILGTAAAEGWPAIFCSCEACRRAGDAGGKNLRTRSSLQIDDLLKVDIPPDTLMHVRTHRLDLSKLKYLLLTHSHSDHLCFSEVEYLFAPFSMPPRNDSLKVFANEASLELIRAKVARHAHDDSGLLNTIEPFVTMDMPPYTVTAVRANHGPEKNPLNYLVEKDNRSFLYACDTGPYEEATWEFLSGHSVDLVISECTEGPKDAKYGMHMGIPNVEEFRAKARSIGLVREDTPWILTHFSHGGGLLHEELEQIARPLGFTIAWDGMEVSV